MTDRNKFKVLKARYIGKSQEVKRLKKMLKIQKEAHAIVLNDYHLLVADLQNAFDDSLKTIEKLKKRKWYQFQKLEN
jgi:hypothetical protein